ncbi:MAG: cytochrome bd-I ubiquinol oxidase subunit CydA [Gammaproteobacteria bacterium]|nr:MAG: cytochrome bd-I ubiquinol oxidase subunit CydA [Gammaproteobacteria bacterium]
MGGGAVELSRLQFAATALYHFLFVPLTLGLSWLLVIMEAVYVMTGREIYRQMTRFWGKLFGINFAMGVATGLTMEFQFGTNWSYYAHYVGDVFGVPLAIEGLVAFFLESTFVGLFFFGWDRLSRVQHLAVTFLVALGSNLSALWILVANAWMQHPAGAAFEPQTLRMELQSFGALLFNPVAQVKFVHTVAAGYVTGATFVLAVSAWYLLRGRHVALARRSFAVAAGFGLAGALSVVVLGDESGYELGAVQRTKLAAIEAEWETEEPPAAFTLFGLPDQEARRTDYALRIPWVLGLIATRSVDEPVTGLKDILAENERRIRSGAIALEALRRLRAGVEDPQERRRLETRFQAHQEDLGYGLLLSLYAADPARPSEAEIRRAVEASIPRVAPLFWVFRVMVASGFALLLLFVLAFWYSGRREAHRRPWLLRYALWALPLPWVAAESGWIVSEYGRQPWAIGEVLPTGLAASQLPPAQVEASLAGFVLFYTLLLAADLYLMLKQVRLGPGPLGGEVRP